MKSLIGIFCEQNIKRRVYYGHNHLSMASEREVEC